MKAGSTLFLRVALVLIALAVLAFCVFALPAGIMSDNTGYYRPILIGMYFPMVPFFLALYQAWKLLNYIDKNQAFSSLSVKALKTIKYCAIAISAMYVAGMPLIFNAGDRDDAPGVVAIALGFIFACLVVATFAALLQKLVESAIEMKSEHDLTI
jgi:hypothetical protein